MSESIHSGAFNEIAEFIKKQGRRETIVPGFGGKKVYFKPFAPHAKTIALKLIEPGDSQSTLNAAYVCVNALNEDGSKMFRTEDFEEMKHWNVGDAFDVLSAQMNSFTTPEDAKNSYGTTPG